MRGKGARARVATVVPAGTGLVVEALLLNRDSGAVRPGMDAVVKVEAFPFTRHGVLRGTVEHVGADAVADEARGLVYPARVALAGTALTGGAEAALVPGMAVTAEVVTGRRTVADYLLSPIARATQEAGRER